jgi:predicted HTH transcriptional regulator
MGYKNEKRETVDDDERRNIEKYGTGFIRIRKYLEEYPDVKVTIDAVGGFIVATIRQVEEAEDKAVNGGLNGGLNEALEALYTCIKKNGGIQAKDLAALLDRPIDTVDKQIKKHSILWNQDIYTKVKKSCKYFNFRYNLFK